MGRGGRGGGRGGRDGGRGGGRGFGGGGRGFRDDGPPDFVVECGQLMHECESEMVCKVSHKESKIPHFNAGIYLENKKKIGKVDEVRYSTVVVQYTFLWVIFNVKTLSYIKSSCPPDVADLWNSKQCNVYSETGPRHCRKKLQEW
jgi:H/ACA ribonucleoprotein complex subunit 1